MKLNGKGSVTLGRPDVQETNVIRQCSFSFMSFYYPPNAFVLQALFVANTVLCGVNLPNW